MDEAKQVIQQIIKINSHLAEFWSNARGWAPKEAAQMLSKSRLDWQVSLSYRLRETLKPHSPEEDQAKLIEAWTRLGTLTENTMKLVNTVYLMDYRKLDAAKRRDGTVPNPDGRSFEDLKKIYCDRLAEAWHKTWLNDIQQLRNSIHAFKDRNIWDWGRYFNEQKNYLRFLKYSMDWLPYPEPVYKPYLPHFYKFRE